MTQITFDEEKINIVLMMMEQLRIEGVRQASLLVNMHNILTGGKKAESQEKTGTVKEGK